MATAKWTAYATADTAVAGTSMNALASGAAAANYALGSAIDNSTDRYFYGVFNLVLSSAVTTGSGAPRLDIYVIPAVDGTNYATTNGGTSAGPTAINYFAGSIFPPASTAVQTLTLLLPSVLPQSLFKIMINNVLGVAFPSTNTSVCTLRRFGEEA